MNELLMTLLSTLQALVVLLVAQGGTVPPEAQALLATPNALGTNTTSQYDTAITPITPLTFDEINQQKADAVVNILCRGAGQFSSGTATGVIVSPTGLVLVNAHIAQYMLLEQATDATISCVMRTGSPAVNTYKAEVIYMPPAWVSKHASHIREREQTGTGEDDYALLQITESINDRIPMPSTFPYVAPSINTDFVKDNKNVLVRAYPAEFLGSNIAIRALRPVATIATLGELATFNPDDPSIDLISLGGSIVAQGGSSGGAVINSNGELVGIVVTSTRTEQTKDRNLGAITLSHINTSLSEATDMTLDEFLQIKTEDLKEMFKESLLESAQVFADVYNM